MNTLLSQLKQFSIVVADIDEADSERVTTAIGDAGGSAKAIRTDVTDAASVEAMVQFAVDTFGGLDIAVNNAGIGGPLSESDR